MEQTFVPGTRADHDWYEQPISPVVAFDGQFIRAGDEMFFVVPPFGDSEGNYGFANSGFSEIPIDRVRTRLYAGGELVFDAPSEFGEVTVPAGSQRFRLVMDVSRAVDWWQLGARTHTEWGFRSDTVSDLDYESVPLLSVAYDIPLDLINSVRKGGVPITFTVTDPTGRAGDVSAARLWTSVDHGKTWRSVTGLSALGNGRFSAEMKVTQGPVSLRVTAGDGAGNSVRQDIIDAFVVR
jgi:hypothetical protein